MSETGIKLNLHNVSGNAFAILGVCRRALQRAGQLDRWESFHAQATSGDYNNLLCTVADWLDVCFSDEEFFEDGGEDYDEDEN